MIRALALAALLSATPAAARDLSGRLRDMPNEAYGTVALFAADSALTYSIVRDGGRECNPVARAIIGKHPGAGKLAAFTVGKSLLFLGGISLLQDIDPKAARTASRVSLVIQGGVVGLNLKARF